MWPELEEVFKNKPSQQKVVEMLLEFGFAVLHEGDKARVYAAEIELPISKVARAVGVDRKVVDQTIETIVELDFLYAVFSRLKPVADISEVAKHAKTAEDKAILTKYTGRGVMEIRALSESVGIAAEATRLLADKDLSIQFMLAKDPRLSVESTLVIVTDKRIPGTVVDRLLRDPNIISVQLS